MLHTYNTRRCERSWVLVVLMTCLHITDKDRYQNNKRPQTLALLNSHLICFKFNQSDLFAINNRYECCFSMCLVVVERLFLAVPRGCLWFVIVVFPDHIHLLFLMSRLLCLCCVVTVKSFPVLAFNVVIITIVRIYT